VATTPEVGIRGQAPEEIVSPEPQPRAAVPLAAVAGRQGETSERLQAAKGVLQQTLQRMLDENPDLAQRLIRGVRAQEEVRPEAAEPEARAGSGATVLPEMQQALLQILPGLNQEDLRRTLNSAVNRPDEKGQLR
jgi:hypothetical protein